MEKNVGGLDRMARLVVGPLAAIAGLAVLGGVVTFGTGPVWALAVPLVLLVVGVVFVVTGYTQRCPLNSVLGVDTCPGSESGAAEHRPPSTE